MILHKNYIELKPQINKQLKQRKKNRLQSKPKTCPQKHILEKYIRGQTAHLFLPETAPSLELKNRNSFCNFHKGR